MAEYLEDFPAGPLDLYRKQASFDWKQLKLFTFGEADIKDKYELYEKVRQHPEFLPPTKPLTLDEERYVTFRQFAIFRQNPEKFVNNGSVRCIAPSVEIKFGLCYILFGGMIRQFGSARHQHFIDDLESGRIIGCFCLTEVGYGSDVKGMQTRATYDSSTKEFVLHTPDFRAAKCWAGGLGLMATHGIVYAQLYLNDKCHGLHIFVVPIRDPDTLLPYRGVTVGDMGSKNGLEGIDNGFLIFDNYRIPRDNLLDKIGDVTNDGRYVSPITDENKRFASSLLALSVSRVRVISLNTITGTNALAIAVRYSAVRTQFGPTGNKTPIIEYQTHQYRLFPYLAAAYIFNVVTQNLMDTYDIYIHKSDTVDNPELLGLELHVITSAVKPASGWLMRDAIQSSREACGGHGYLKASGLGALKNSQDPCLTLEGENWVLIQQVANFLIKLWQNVLAGVEISSPLKSVDFLSDGPAILERGKFRFESPEQLYRPEAVLEIYQWLTVYLLKRTHDKRQELQGRGIDKLAAQNNTQVFLAVKLGVAFNDHYVLQTFLHKIEQTADQSLRAVLLKLFLLYALYGLEKFLGTLYQSGYAVGERPAVLIQEGILHFCAELKNDAVALVDVLAPPDFILNSVLGASDGQVYERLERSFFTSPYGTGRPTWWKDLVNWKDVARKAESKL